MALSPSLSPSLNNSRFLHITHHLKDPGCRRAVLKGTHRARPSKQFLTKSLAWSEISLNLALAE